MYQYNPGGNTTSYTYGIDNLRKTKTVNGVATGFIWNGSDMVAETDGNSIQKIYSYTIDGIALTVENGQKRIYNKNAHGDVISRSGEDGIPIEYYSYDAFGNELLNDGSNPFQYAGEYVDDETDFIYLRNRYYAPSNGRFITEDPIKDGLNWYVYCGGNPVMLVDPFGLESEIPAWADWDGDGRVDTQEDKERFDTNNNQIADWNENGNVVRWYQMRNSNMLQGFPHVYQGSYDLCWAACISMVTEWFTGEKVSFIDIAKDYFGSDDVNEYNKSIANVAQAGVIMKDNNYLFGSGYEVDTNGYNGGYIYNGNKDGWENPLTYEVIIELIDAGIPMLINSSPDHAEVVIGYAYDEELGNKRIMTHNPAAGIHIIEFNQKITGNFAVGFKQIK